MTTETKSVGECAELRSADEVRWFLRFVTALLDGPDLPEKPVKALKGERVVLEWMLKLRGDPPDMHLVEVLEAFNESRTDQSGFKTEGQS